MFNGEKNVLELITVNFQTFFGGATLLKTVKTLDMLLGFGPYCMG